MGPGHISGPGPGHVSDPGPGGPAPGPDQPSGQGRVSRIHTERYLPWKGSLHSRGAIILNGAREGFRHNLDNKWVKALITISWFFTVFIILLQASFGEIRLVHDTPADRFDRDTLSSLVTEYDMEVPFSANIEQGETATYTLTIVNTGMRPDVVRVFFGYVEPEWGVEFREPGGNESLGELYLNLTLDGSARFETRVTPPPWMVSGTGFVEIFVESQGTVALQREDWWFRAPRRIPVMTVVGQTERSPFHFTMTTPDPYLRVRAGSRISFPVTVTNTGTEHDILAISIQGLPDGWRGFLMDVPNLDLPFLQGPGLELAPGENVTFTVTFTVPDHTMPVNFIGVVARSSNDPSLTGGVMTVLDVYDITPMDRTAEVFAEPDGGLFGFLLLLFTLFLAAVVGSRAISQDLAEKSFTLYFSRPITKMDYIMIKWGSVAATLSMVTLVPMLVVNLGLILLSEVDADYIIGNLWVWGAIILHSLLIVSVFTTLSLGFSSLTTRRFYAAFGLAITYFISAIISGIIVEDFDEGRGTAVSIYHSLQMVGARIFGVSGIHQEYDWRYNLLLLLTIILVSALGVILKIGRTELSE